MAVGIQDPAIDIVPITPNDSADISTVSVSGETRKSRALYIGTGGAIKVTTANGNDRTVTVPAGILPVQVVRVWSTGTSASNISALY